MCLGRFATISDQVLVLCYHVVVRRSSLVAIFLFVSEIMERATKSNRTLPTIIRWIIITVAVARYGPGSIKDQGERRRSADL